MKAANPDPIHFGWLDIGRSGHKSQSNIGFLFHTQSVAQSSTVNTVLCWTQDKSNNPVFRLRNFLALCASALSYGFPVSVWSQQCWRGTAALQCFGGVLQVIQTLLQLLLGSLDCPLLSATADFRKDTDLGARQGGIHVCDQKWFRKLEPHSHNWGSGFMRPLKSFLPG